MALYRPQLRQQNILSSWEVKRERRRGSALLVAGLTVWCSDPARPRVTFQSLEDEAGT
ncbi:MAG: hypothetical protein R2911_39235 [Caldilineaceae bacterium]